MVVNHSKDSALALSDPQTITIDGVANTLARTGMGVNSGTFSSSDGTVKELVSHQYGRRIRRTARLDHAKIAADPLTSDNVRYSMSAYVVIDTPVDGYTVAEAQDVVDGLLAYLTASSGLVVTKILGGEV